VHLRSHLLASLSGHTLRRAAWWRANVRVAVYDECGGGRGGLCHRSKRSGRAQCGRQRLGPADRLRAWIPEALVFLAAPDRALRGTGFSGSPRSTCAATGEARTGRNRGIHAASPRLGRRCRDRAYGRWAAILSATTGVRPSCGIRRCFIPTRSGRWGRSQRAVSSARERALLSSSRDHLQRGVSSIQIYFQHRGRRGASWSRTSRAPCAGCISRCPGRAPQQVARAEPPEARCWMGSSIRSPFRTG